MAQKKDDRVRNWTFIVYPESAPEDWIDKLAEIAPQTLQEARRATQNPFLILLPFPLKKPVNRLF